MPVVNNPITTRISIPKSTIRNLSTHILIPMMAAKRKKYAACLEETIGVEDQKSTLCLLRRSIVAEDVLIVFKIPQIAKPRTGAII